MWQYPWCTYGPILTSIGLTGCYTLPGSTRGWQLARKQSVPPPWIFLLFAQGPQGASRVIQPRPVLGPLDALGRVLHLLLRLHPHLPHRPSLGLQASQSWSVGEHLAVSSLKYLIFSLTCSICLNIISIKIWQIFPLEGHWGYGNWKNEVTSCFGSFRYLRFCPVFSIFGSLRCLIFFLFYRTQVSLVRSMGLALSKSVSEPLVQT